MRKSRCDPKAICAVSIVAVKEAQIGARREAVGFLSRWRNCFWLANQARLEPGRQV